MISYSKALAITLATIDPLPSIEVGLPDLVGQVTAECVRAHIESPSADLSLKDGYAVRSGDIRSACSFCSGLQPAAPGAAKYWLGMRCAFSPEPRSRMA